MRKRHRERQLDLLAPTGSKSTNALPEALRSEALRALLIEVIVAERGGETGDDEDQR